MLHESFTKASEKATEGWEGTRGKHSQECQLRQALNTLLEVLGPKGNIPVEKVNLVHLKRCTDLWKEQGKSPSTINARLSTLGRLGIKTEGAWVKDKLPPKWWLRPEEQVRLLAHLRKPKPPFALAPLLADYVEFISYTGLRVEEALRLSWRDVSLNVHEADGTLRSLSEMTVPGTKTRRSHATLALGVLPSMLLLKRKKLDPAGTTVFPTEYQSLHEGWQKARTYLGEQHNNMATLKALRRTAARHLTVSGMPTEMVRDYLRHSDIKTTMGYLHLVGGYSTTEQRKYLS